MKLLPHKLLKTFHQCAYNNLNVLLKKLKKKLKFE